MIDFDEYYDALYQRLQGTDKGLQPKYAFILWAASLKFAGIFLVLATLTIVLFHVQVIDPSVLVKPLKTPTPTGTATLVPTATQTPSHTPTFLPTPTAKQPDTATPTSTITLEPTIASTFVRYDGFDPSENSEIGIPLNGLVVEDLPLIISQSYSVADIYSDVGHHGVDLGYYDYKGKYILDLPINSIFSGQVAGIILDKPPLGYAIVVETRYESLPEEYSKALGVLPGESLYIMYAHMIEAPLLQIGDPIAWQQQIGNVGQSQTVEAHLHLETRIGKSGYTFNSMAFYDTNATDEERATYLYWRTSGDLRPFDPMILFNELYHD